MKCQATCLCALVLPPPASPFTKPCVISSSTASKFSVNYRYHDESRVRKRPLLMTSQAVDIFSVGHRDLPESSLPRDTPHAAKQSDTGVPVYNPSDLGLHLKMGSKVITPYGFLFAMQAWISAAIMFPFCFLAAVLSAVFDWRRMRLPTIVALWWGRRVMLNMGIRPTVEGAELLPPPEEPVVFVANHGSYLDIPVTNFLPRLCKYLMKAELLWLPIVGWKAVVSKDIFVHRQTSATFRRLISTTTRSLKAGNSILAFPEGTRSRNGRLGKFKRGPFTMAQKAGVRIVPVSITGVVNAMPPFALAPLVKPRDTKLVIHHPISTKGRPIKEVIAEARRAVGDSLEDWQKPIEVTAPSPPPTEPPSKPSQ